MFDGDEGLNKHTTTSYNSLPGLVECIHLTGFLAMFRSIQSSA